jgi:capsular polysaccharide biosynthesis protein
VDLRRAASVLWPHRLTLVIVAVVGALGGIFVSSLMTPTFESEATLLVADASGRPPSAYEDLLASEILARTYAELGHTTPVLVDALDRAGVDIQPADLAERTIVEAIRNTALIRVVARADSAEDAHALATALATGVSDLASTDESGTRLVVVDPADEPTEPVSPRLPANAVVGAAAAVLATAAVILLVTRRKPEAEPEFSTFEEQAQRRRSVGSDHFTT